MLFFGAPILVLVMVKCTKATSSTVLFLAFIALLKGKQEVSDICGLKNFG